MSKQEFEIKVVDSLARIEETLKHKQTDVVCSSIHNKLNARLDKLYVIGGVIIFIIGILIKLS